MTRGLWASVVCCAMFPFAAVGQVSIQVDAAQDVRPISPLIYGANYASAEHLQGGVTMTRWGGNATSRYNYEIDVTNTGADYFFENIPGCWTAAQNYCATPPSNPKEQSSANAFLQEAASAGVTAFFTVPALGWVSKSPAVYNHPFPCGCPKSVTPNQDAFDPYDPECGSGTFNGAYVTCAGPAATSVAITAEWNRQWAAYLVSKFGPSNGRRIYQVDNEPNLWSSTHRDVRTTPLTYDELWEKMRDHAVAVLDSDPTAEIAGPAEWGWPNYFCSDADDVQNGCSASSPDRAAHGGTELMAWLLQQAKAYEMTNGRRILHYLDLHYYPQGGTGPEVTRSLWDPTYKDPSWIDNHIRLIPRMREWVDQNYPGTKIAISEYDFYHHDEPLGAVLYADTLGIFGREGVHAATTWAPPEPSEIAFAAFKLFRNYDGAGATFGNTNIRATVAGAPGLNAYAATRAGAVTVVLVNGTTSAVTAPLTISNVTVANSAQWYARGTGSAIVRGADLPVTNGTVQISMPAMSIALLVVNADVAGETDAGVSAPDAGSGGGSGGGATDAGGDSPRPATSGCGCSTGGPGALIFALAFAFAAHRTARRRRGVH